MNCKKKELTALIWAKEMIIELQKGIEMDGESVITILYI